MKLKEDEISFLQGYVAQLTQSISRLTLKPSEEEIKKKGWWSSGNERNATTILESKMPVLDLNYKSNNLAHTSPPHIRPSPGSHPPATVAADRKSLGPSHSRPPAPEGRPACMRSARASAQRRLHGWIIAHTSSVTPQYRAVRVPGVAGYSARSRFGLFKGRGDSGILEQFAEKQLCSSAS